MVAVPNQTETPSPPPSGPAISDWKHFHQPDDGASRLLDVIEAQRFLCDLVVGQTSGNRGHPAMLDVRAEGVVSMFTILGREMEMAYGQITAVKR